MAACTLAMLGAANPTCQQLWQHLQQKTQQFSCTFSEATVKVFTAPSKFVLF